jgi:phospholipid/cholesterol/gamma-HCH transport system substrate-binding protein
MKKIFSREVKIGLLVVLTGVVLFYGLNFLKGVNILNPTNYYKVEYADLAGLTEDASVFSKGYKIGRVSEISYDYTKEIPFVVTLDIERDIQIPEGAVAQLTSDGLIRGKCIKIEIDPTAATFLSRGDTIKSQVVPDLMDALAKDLVPKVNQIVSSADSLLLSVRAITEGEDLKESLTNIKSITSNLETTTNDLNVVIKNDVPRIVKKVDNVAGSLAQVGEKVNRIDFEKTMNGVDSTVVGLQTIVDKCNQKDGTIGLLLNDKTLYNNLTGISRNADSLVVDLKQNPKRYVHFSLFGAKDKKDKK